MRTLPQKATQRQTKTYNSRLVLKTIYDQRRISRAEVARLTQLTRTTVSDMVTDLQDQGLVQEVGHGPSVGGRSPILLSVVDEARHVIGLDLANDEFHGAVLNLRNEILHTVTLPLDGRCGEAAVELVYALADALLARTNKPLLGIGIGTPGLVDTQQGVVRRAVNLDWHDLPLAGRLEERYRLPVYVANDSQVAALTQSMFGDGQRDANMVVIKVGHGIGAGLVLNGHLFQGDGFGAGEIGHIVVVEDGRQCRCGNFGCLETVVSTPSICRRAQELAAAAPDSLLNTRGAGPAAITLDAVRRAADAGDATARQVVRETGRYLGIAAAYLVGTVNARRIAVVGPVTAFGAPLQDALRQEMLRRALPQLAQETQVDLAGPGTQVVMLGASALLLAREFGLSLGR